MYTWPGRISVTLDIPRAIHTHVHTQTQIAEKQSGVQREMKRAYTRQSKHKMRFGGEPITSRLFSLPFPSRPFPSLTRRINSYEYRGLSSISFDSPVCDRKVRIGYTARIAMSVTRFFVKRGINEHGCTRTLILLVSKQPKREKRVSV